MADSNEGCPALRRLGLAALALACGWPLLAFFALITWGAVLLPAAGLALLAPLLLANYFLWR